MTTTRYIAWELKSPGVWIGRSANGKALVEIDQYLSGGHRRAVLYLIDDNGKPSIEGVYKSITHAKGYANELARLLTGEGSVI